MKLTDVLTERTKTKPQETPDFKLNKPKETFSFNTPINFSEEIKSFSAVKVFEAANSDFKIADQNKSFSISTPGHWPSRGEPETVNRIQKY